MFSGDWGFDYSFDGLSWVNKYTMSSYWTPEGVGLFMRGTTVTGPYKNIFSFFRMVEDSSDIGPDNVLLGDRLAYMRYT